MTGADVNADAPLMEAGLDSAAAVEFQGLLCEQSGVDELPETLVFDYPTLRDVARLLGGPSGRA